MINSYTFGKFIVDNETYESNIILLGEKVKPARHLPGHELKIDDFTELVEFKPEIVIIGTGESGVVKVQKEIIDFIEQKGIKLLIEKTPQAYNSYNDLIKQRKKVAAFLHNTC